MQFLIGFIIYSAAFLMNPYMITFFSLQASILKQKCVFVIFFLTARKNQERDDF